MKRLIIFLFSILLFLSFNFSQVRYPVDRVGFCYKDFQIEKIIKKAEELERKGLDEKLKSYGLNSDVRWIYGICPHDDHLYAGRVYYNILRNLRAKTVVIFGVTHSARRRHLTKKLIFGTFPYYYGVYGNIKVSPLREEIEKRLGKDFYVINNPVVKGEHSIEALLPFIQYYNRNVEILPIYVPVLNYKDLVSSSEKLSQIFVDLIKKNHWKLGRDIAFVSSADCVHYGDWEWGKHHYAPYGCCYYGHERAVKDDIFISQSILSGVISDKNMERFTEKVWSNDVSWPYKITWCGCFSIPYGLRCVNLIKEKLEGKPLRGYFLRYGDSYTFGKLLDENVGIGLTAICNLHHWVGYTAIGYK